MKRLTRVTFLIHGFCYASMAVRAGALDENLAPYLDRESRCAAEWQARLDPMAGDEEGALVIIPWVDCQAPPVAGYCDAAAAALGDRCFVLDCPDCTEPAFWRDAAGSGAARVAGEIEAACVGQKMAWNKEELDTALHCCACAQRLDALLAERGYALDPGRCAARAWGASFDGCVTKYTLNLRRMLGLASPIDIDFELTVPDARFLLDARPVECIAAGGGARVFLFTAREQAIGLFTATAESPAARPAVATLEPGLAEAVVLSKQGIRLWPQPQPYILAGVPAGYGEPPQDVVTAEGGRLSVPVSAGYVYRLAKAPAYVFAPPGMAWAEFRDRLASARYAGA